MDKSKVFLSSSQFNEEFIVERESLPLLFNKDPLKEKFLLWRIEDFASPDEITQHFLQNVESCDIFLLLIGKEFRKAVYEEYKSAYAHKKQIFCFIKHYDDRAEQVDKFIREVQGRVTTTDYHDLQQLSKKIEESFVNYFFIDGPARMSISQRENEKKEMDKTERALRIIVGIFDSGQSELTREKVITKYVEYVLKDKSELSTKDMIINDIQRYFPDLNIDINSSVENSLIKMVHDGIVAKKEEKYILIKDNKTEFSNDIGSFELKVIRKIYKKYQTVLKSDFENFKSNFIPCLTQIIYRTALNTTSAIFNGDFNTDEYNKESLQVVISHEIGALLGEIDDLREFEQIVYDVLTSSDDDIIDFLKILFKSYWMLCLLNIDPEVIEIQKNAFSNYIFYLDSHIVIRAMVEAGGSSNLCSEIIRLCNDSKLKMRLSYTIYIEVKKAFESAYSIFRETAGDTDRAIRIFQDLSRKSDIIEGYIFAKQKNRNLSWQTYMNRFFSPIKKDKLKNYLNRELNIEVMDQREFTEGEWGRIEEIKDLLLSRRNVTIDDKNSDQDKKIDKQVILRTNEATQMAIIYNYRNGDDDHQYWFVTFDKFVYEASIELSKQSDDMYGFPCFIKPARMLEMLSQLKHDKVEVNTFRSILNSESIHIVANSIETEIIAELLRNRVDYNVESKETLREMYDDILSRPILQDAYQKYANSEENIDEADANKIIKDTIIETLQDNLKKQNMKIHGLNDEIVDKTIQLRKEKKRSKYLRGQLTRATKRK